MELEYPKYDEQIYNVVDQTLDATKQEDVVLAEKEFKESLSFMNYEIKILKKFGIVLCGFLFLQFLWLYS